MEISAPVRSTLCANAFSVQLSRQSRFSVWHKRLFAWMMRNSHDASAYFSIPPDQVVEMGQRLEV